MGEIEQISKSELAQSLYMYGVLHKYSVSPHNTAPIVERYSYCIT